MLYFREIGDKSLWKDRFAWVKPEYIGAVTGGVRKVRIHAIVDKT